MSDISISLQTSARDHWAHVQAAAGGDTEFYNTTSECGQSGRGRSLDADSPTYASIFDKEEEDLAQRASWLYARVNKDLTPAHPYVDFEFEIPHDTPVDFTSYYTAPKNLLQLRLTVLYSADVAKCMRPDAVQPIEEESTTDDAEKTEEGLWDTYTRVGQPPSDSKWLRSMHLHATVPITIVGGGAEPARPIVHYLTPGAAAPVLRRGAQTDMPASFPAVQPVFTVEGFSNTSARLLQPGSTDPAQHMQQLMNMTHSLFKYPDPTRDYRGENFASLLWKKKVIAEERGIWPVRNEVVDGGDAQKPFSVVP
ncbi:hypothetical protein B0H19DRAFT_517405 [Mycena capillaripes]|nr:hypothetical protein B0H19DRAFT_517405 [Mycena capillaripes]